MGGGGVDGGGGVNWDCSRLLCFYMIVYPRELPNVLEVDLVRTFVVPFL